MSEGLSAAAARELGRDCMQVTSRGNWAYVFAPTVGPTASCGCVYALVNLRTREIAYAGKTAQRPRDRLTQHMRSAAGGGPKNRWVRSGASDGVLAMVVIQHITAGPKGTDRLSEAELELGQALGPLGVGMLNTAAIPGQSAVAADRAASVRDMLTRHSAVLDVVRWSCGGSGWYRHQAAPIDEHTVGFDVGGHKFCVDCMPTDVPRGAVVRLTSRYPSAVEGE